MRTATIQGREVLLAPNWTITKKLQGKATLSATVVWPLDFKPSVDNRIELYNDSGILLSGVITKSEPKENGQVLQYSIQASDNNALADRRLVASVSYEILAGELIRTVILPVLAPEGITEGNIQDGPLIQKAVFPYKTAAEALNAITDLCPGYFWRITDEKRLDFFARDTFEAPVTLDDSFQHSGFSYTRDTSDYRNVQWLFGAKGETNEQIAAFSVTEATTKAEFLTRFPIVRQPDIYVNGARVDPALVGVNGLNSDLPWLWSYESTQLTYESGEELLGMVEVHYYGAYPLIIRSERGTEISRKRGLSPGTSGVFESVVQEKSITSRPHALQYVTGLLDKYASDAEKVKFKTEYPALEPGMLLAVNKPRYGLQTHFLITDVRIAPVDSDHIRCDVTASGGNLVGGWTEYFAALVRKTTDIVIGGNETIITLTEFSEPFDYTGSYNMSQYAGLYPATALFPSASVFPGGPVTKEVLILD